MLSALIFLLLGPLIGLAFGWLLGGRLANLVKVRLRALWLLWLAAGVQAVQYYSWPLRTILQDRLGISILAFVFAIVAVWLAVNLRPAPPVLRFAVAIILAGAALNATVIAMNGRMPYSMAAARTAGLPAGSANPKNAPADANTRLAFIGDVIPVAPLRKIVSPGDLLIILGAAATVAAAMRRRPPELVPTAREEVSI
jgi:Family of unknown function (DUF5317)